MLDLKRNWLQGDYVSFMCLTFAPDLYNLFFLFLLSCDVFARYSTALCVIYSPRVFARMLVSKVQPALTRIPRLPNPSNLAPTDELDSHMYQTVGHEAVELVAQALRLPLFRRTIAGGSVSIGRVRSQATFRWAVSISSNPC